MNRRPYIIFSLFICVIINFGCKNDGLFSTREEDQNKLNAEYEVIQKLSIQFSCENASEWKFTAIGAKGCGGPTGYIAYSSKIDEHDFLEKVKVFTNHQKEFNVKWNIVSDCMYNTPPNSVICENGKPKFVYNTP